MITLDDTITLEDMEKKRATLIVTMETKAQTVLAELGQNALKSGYWNNGIGQMGAYANEAGLRVLAGSNNAISFTRDVTHAYRIKAVDDDDSLETVEAAINTNGSANVDIFLSVDAADYDIDSSGSTVFKPSATMSQQTQNILDDMTSQNYAIGIKNAEKDANKPVIRANIDKNAFYALVERDDVRAIRPIGYVDPRTAQWPEEALEAAQEHGEAEIMITLRGGELFSPKTGYMSTAAIKAQANANQRAFDDILSRIGMSAPATESSANSEIGVLHTRLPFESLAKLYDGKDTRILSIELNKPVAWTTLTNSTVLLNMASAWNAGYRAAGQNIVILDTGIRKNHAFFTTGGISRITYEACFGTNGVSNGITYSSICPGQNSTWDSSPLGPQGFVGSGEPYSNLTVCNTLASLGTHDCGHGTHVAGIAAGRKSTSLVPSNLQGVGPDASIISVQVFSYNNTSPKAAVFASDVQKALESVLAAATLPGTTNPYIVNMSLGFTDYSNSSTCDNALPSVSNTVANLTSKGIPVVAATGNNSNKNGISWPACISQAIKVSSVANDVNGTALAGFANIGNPASFTGPILLAPGGSSTTTVNSSDRISTTATKLLKGTSQATPHATGIYAALKAANPTGISVADATGWIVSTGSIALTYSLPSPVNTQTYRRIRLPNL
ncbi:MAG: S8 family serine peptidase [Nitrosomonas sp.]|nr:S8 family serine peptidase [Nitrosomonas sp.]